MQVKSATGSMGQLHEGKQYNMLTLLLFVTRPSGGKKLPRSKILYFCGGKGKSKREIIALIRQSKTVKHHIFTQGDDLDTAD